MTTDVVTVGPASSAKQAAELMAERGFAALPVVDADGRLVGIVAEADVLRDRLPQDPVLHARRDAPGPAAPGPALLVDGVMTTAVRTVGPTADVADLARLFVDEQVRSVPVLDDGAVVGIVSRRDVLRVLVRPDADIRADVLHLVEAYTAEPGCFAVDVTEGITRISRTRGAPQVSRAVEAFALQRLATTVPGVLAVDVGAGVPGPRPGRLRPPRPSLADGRQEEQDVDSSAEQRRRAVVAGVDASPAATAVVRFAAEEAAARGIALHLVHVVPWPNPGAAWTSCADRVWVDGLRGEAEELLDAAAARVAGTVPPERIHRTVGFGDPVAELVQASTGADLLVVGPRGTGGVTGMIIGSTATGVAAHARCAVVVLPGGAAADRTDRKRVVAGVAGAEGDDAVLSFALAEARLRQTDLVAVHAWQDPVTDSGYRSAGRLVDWTGPEAEEQRVLAEALAGLRREEPDVAVRELVVRSRVSPALLEAGRDAELLVVGRRDHGLLGRLGSAGHAVLHRAGCPVALVPVPAGAPR